MGWAGRLNMSVVAAITWGAGYAQDYPNRLVRIVVASPGGGSDFTARRIAGGIAAPLGQSVIVDYRGASLLSLEYVMKSPPDGYTLYVTGSTLWVVPLLRKSPYDAERDFTPITLTDQSPFVVAVHPSLPVKSVRELIDFAKARPGELNYGASAPGRSTWARVAPVAVSIRLRAVRCSPAASTSRRCLGAIHTQLVATLVKAIGSSSSRAILESSMVTALGTGGRRAKAARSASPCRPRASRASSTTHRHSDGSRTRATIGEK